MTRPITALEAQVEQFHDDLAMVDSVLDRIERGEHQIDPKRRGRELVRLDDAVSDVVVVLLASEPARAEPNPSWRLGPMLSASALRARIKQLRGDARGDLS